MPSHLDAAEGLPCPPGVLDAAELSRANSGCPAAAESPGEALGKPKQVLSGLDQSRRWHADSDSKLRTSLVYPFVALATSRQCSRGPPENRFQISALFTDLGQLCSSPFFLLSTRVVEQYPSCGEDGESLVSGINTCSKIGPANPRSCLHAFPRHADALPMILQFGHPRNSSAQLAGLRPVKIPAGTQSCSVSSLAGEPSPSLHSSIANVFQQH